MKKIFISIFIFTLFFPWQNLQAAEVDSLADRLAGKILLQVESYGRAWYVDPETKTRCYLKNGEEAYQIMRQLSLGITNKDLARLPVTINDAFDGELVERLKGRIVLQVEEHGEAWYVNPDDGLRYYMKDGQAAFQMMRNFGLGINNDNLAKIPASAWQVVPDTAFNSVVSAAYDGSTFRGGQNSQVILPLASLTKLMTALVFLETNPNWDHQVTITQDQIDYPRYYVGNDTTSEVDLQVGDRVKIEDLWISMLVASSNQAAAVLADNSGYSFEEFITKMNNKAVELGLVKTKFFDVAGLDAHNVSTAEEFSRLAYEAFTQFKIKWGGGQNEYSFFVRDIDNQERKVNVKNRNYSLLAFEPDVAKTGFLIEAQRNVALLKNGKVIVVLHARSMSERNSLINSLIN